MGDPVTIGLTVASTAFSAIQQINAGRQAAQDGKDAQVRAEYEAMQLETQAGQERAAAQRKVIEERRRAKVAQSNATAKMAATGGDTLDPSVIKILGDLEAEGQYNADVAAYEGEDAARNKETGASLKRHDGELARIAGNTAKKAAYFKAGSSIFSGGSTLMDKYGGGGPETIYWNQGGRSTYR